MSAGLTGKRYYVGRDIPDAMIAFGGGALEGFDTIERAIDERRQFAEHLQRIKAEDTGPVRIFCLEEVEPPPAL